jgi:hypothetical protein
MLVIAQALLRRAYAVPERALVWVHVGLACLVAVAHGGALLVAAAQQPPELPNIRATAMISLPLAAATLASALLALVRPAHTRSVLFLHGVALFAAATWLLVWATTILFVGVREVNFVWMVGILSVLVLYGSVAAVRFVLPPAVRSRPLAFYFPAFALLIALIVDFGVLARAL